MASADLMRDDLDRIAYRDLAGFVVCLAHGCTAEQGARNRRKGVPRDGLGVDGGYGRDGRTWQSRDDNEAEHLALDTAVGRLMRDAFSAGSSAHQENVVAAPIGLTPDLMTCWKAGFAAAQPRTAPRSTH